MLLLVTVNKLFKKLHIVNNYINVCLLLTVKVCLQLILLSQGNFFLMIDSLEIMHEILFTIPSIIQISSINLRKPRLWKIKIFDLQYLAGGLKDSQWEAASEMFFVSVVSLK